MNDAVDSLDAFLDKTRDALAEAVAGWKAERVEVARLKALIKEVEWERADDPHFASCPWGCSAKLIDCDLDASPRQHDDDCPAFHPDGTVR